MTISEAVKAGIRMIRKPHWNPYARLELNILERGGVGPWAVLHDIDSLQQILLMDADNPPQNDWVSVMMPDSDIVAEDKVEKIGGDYTFSGVVVCMFQKLSGQVRYVVEDDRGVLHIYSAKNLRKVGS